MYNKACEELISKIAEMHRDEVTGLLRGLRCDFKLDFSDEFLASVSLERLRHIALAACLHARELIPGRV